jgi:hypothetical protein
LFIVQNVMFNLQKGVKTLHSPPSRFVPLFPGVPMAPGYVPGLPHKDVKIMVCLIRKLRINEEKSGDIP